ncbi:MAG: SIR2 family protein [Nitrospirae bacterium]|nr:SIR2 family protein [Nitrospirota bacterium]
MKKELGTYEDLLEIVKNTIDDQDIVFAISKLFLIEDDLKLPEGLKNIFIRNEKLGVFVGAGVSKLLGLPLWRELANKSIEYLYESNKINYFEYQRIINDVNDPKQKLTIFHKILPKSTLDAKEFYEKTFENKTKKPNESGCVYDLLVKFDWIKLSSNIDNEFDNALSRKNKSIFNEIVDDKAVLTKKKSRNVINFKVENLDYGKIYPIHGSLVDGLESCVLTTEDYLKTYYENLEFREFIGKIFKEYTILFIGYGLEEFPILEYIIKNSRKHYTLVPTYLNEMNLFRLHKEYFEVLNIEPIPYYLDFKGYERLNDVLSAWENEIKDLRGKDYYQRIREMDDIID